MQRVHSLHESESVEARKTAFCLKRASHLSYPTFIDLVEDGDLDMVFVTEIYIGFAENLSL
jgi:hypothetical protein